MGLRLLPGEMTSDRLFFAKSWRARTNSKTFFRALLLLLLPLRRRNESIAHRQPTLLPPVLLRRAAARSPRSYGHSEEGTGVANLFQCHQLTLSLARQRPSRQMVHSTPSTSPAHDPATRPSSSPQPSATYADPSFLTTGTSLQKRKVTVLVRPSS